mmetsp:Transcript_3570/g.5013  ORF Transcript_3570/g.5013 Transcript_3570/m.5013 type:complete len:214 (-) Transcript_3570:152-793(-)
MLKSRKKGGNGKKNRQGKNTTANLQNEKVVSCLVLGCGGAGKTLIIRKIKQMCKMLTSRNLSPEELQESPFNLSTIVTTGMELSKISYQDTELQLREVGSPLLMMWPTYFKKCQVILYVVGTSNLIELSSAWMEFLELLSAEETREKPIILAFNKIDLCDDTALATAKEIFRLDDIIQTATQQITVMETSSSNGAGITDLICKLHEYSGSGAT